MSQIKYSLNYLLLTLFGTNKFDILNYYSIYKIYTKSNSEITFLQFCVQLKLLRYFNVRWDKSLMLLSSIFFFKTLPLRKIRSLEHDFKTFNKRNSPVMVIGVKLSYVKFTSFWRVWGHRHRPKHAKEDITDVEGFFNTLIKSRKKKAEIYASLGFINNKIYSYLSTSQFVAKVVKHNIVDIKQTYNSLLKKPKFNSSSIVKQLDTNQIKFFEFQFLRKNKIYNKGRYSRCRQNYRTGVYMCMYLSIVCIFGTYYWFFKFSFNFTYLWWLFIAFTSSFLLPKIIKYRLYEPLVISTKVFDFCR
jgi:hypothetical protein